MNRLTTAVISQLVRDFIPLTTDEAKANLIEKLGMHTVNHAAFMLELVKLCGTDHVSAHYAISDYFTATKWMK